MKTVSLKAFVIPSLYVTEIKEYISNNHSSFPLIYLDIEYNKKFNRFRLIVDMSSVALSDAIVSLRSEWLSAPRFSDEYSNVKHFINNIDELPF